MRIWNWCLFVVCGCAALMARGSWAAEPDVQGILTRANAAVGGDKTPPFKAATWKEEGQYFGIGVPVKYESHFAIQPPTRYRMEILDVFTVALDGDKGWDNMGGKISDLDKTQLSDRSDMFHAIRVVEITPLLQDKGYQITLGTETKVNERPAYALKIKHEKHREITAFVDQETNLIVKTVQQVHAEEDNTEKKEEVFYSDYQETAGRKHPTKITIHRDGNKFLETQISDFKSVEKLDDVLFAKP